MRAGTSERALRIFAYGRGMARILQALININTNVTDENEARIAFAHADMFDSYAIAVSTIYLIARAAALVDLLITVFIRRTVAIGDAFYFETA
jgi:transcriptional antiterminator